MRGFVGCVLAVLVIAASVVAKPEDVSLAAANQSIRSAIASVQPTDGEVVGVAHPVVVTFSGHPCRRYASRP